MNKYVKALTNQLVRDNIAEGKLEFGLTIPKDYQERFYNDREEVKQMLTGQGYLVKDSELPDDWSNGWELSPIRLLDPSVPEDMTSEGKTRSLHKRGNITYLNYHIWVKVAN